MRGSARTLNQFRRERKERKEARELEKRGKREERTVDAFQSHCLKKVVGVG